MNPMSIKLDDANFSTWKKEALEAIKAGKVEKLIAKTNDGGRPHKFKTPEDEVLGNISDEYKNWEQKDQVVYTWLLVSISPKLRAGMVGCEHAFQIWMKIEAFLEQKQYEELSKKVKTLKGENSILTQRLENLAEECLEVSYENDGIEKELVEKYGAESVADLLPERPA